MNQLMSITFIYFLFSSCTVLGENQSKKSLSAVFHPEKFDPFKRALNDKDFNFHEEWERNRPWLLANLAHTAYHSPDSIREITSKIGAKTCRVYESDGAEAFLAVWSDKAVLAFRGTQPGSLNDLIADIFFLPRSEGQATVHGGFQGEINKLWEQIAADLNTLTTNKKAPVPVWVTGHSLGGAMATLAGMRFKFEEVVTFGEPMLGRNLSLNFLAKKHKRYVNGNDPVTTLPKLGVKHHGTEIRLTNGDGKTDWRYDHAIIYYAHNLDERRNLGLEKK